MAHSWYYVENNDRVGPIEESELQELITNKSLVEESYVWRKGFDNWMKVEEVEELAEFLKGQAETPKPSFDSLPEQAEEEEEQLEEEEFVEEEPIEEVVEESSKAAAFSWEEIGRDQQVISIKIGADRGVAEAEYGPFSLNMLGKLYREKRINAKTLVFAPGMEDWILFAEMPLFEELANELPPVLDEQERRKSTRKPFVARLLFHDSADIYEGVCRDVSVGGMQVLVADAPVSVQDQISLNVHPDNSDYCFVAKGEVVRLLDGNQGFSLRFVDLSGEAEGAIKSYISQ